MNTLPGQVTSALTNGAPLEHVLRLVLTYFQSETGTIHRLDHETQLLQLVAQIGLPPAMLDIVKTIPVGKGIAGQVIARGGPVTICNLQTDTSGVAKPGARQTGVGGALCVPIRNGDTIVGAVGVGTMRQCEYTAEQTAVLEEIGRVLAKRLV
jgi:L-methionine (R)-S-oxide reductase